MRLNTLISNNYFILFCFTIIGLIAYFNCVYVGLLSDDFGFFFNAKEKGWDLILENFNDPFFLPLTHLFQLVVFKVFGENFVAFHLLQLIIHIAVSWQIFLLVKVQKNSLSVFFPILCGLFFLILPYHTESVVWLSAISYPICMFFALLSIRCYINSRYILFYLLLTLSILCKEMGYIIPFVVIALDWYNYNFKRIRKTLLPITLLVIGNIITRYFVLDSFVGGYGIDRHLSFDLFLILKSIGVYILKYITFFRFSNSPYIAICVVISLAVLTIPFLRNHSLNKFKRSFTLILLLFLITLLPVITLETSSFHSIESDRYGYFNTLIFCISISFFISHWKSQYVPFLSIILATIFCSLTIQDTYKWKKASFICSSYLNKLSAICVNTQSVLLINTPDNFKGVYVLRNGVEDFLKNKGVNVKSKVLEFQKFNSINGGSKIVNGNLVNHNTEKIDYENSSTNRNLILSMNQARFVTFDKLLIYCNSNFKEVNYNQKNHSFSYLINE